MPVIAAVRDLTVAATRLVLRAGAVDVLPLPFTATTWRTPSRRRARHHPRNLRRGCPAWQIVSFVGAWRLGRRAGDTGGNHLVRAPGSV